jgi:hypothetical protein
MFGWMPKNLLNIVISIRQQTERKLAGRLFGGPSALVDSLGRLHGVGIQTAGAGENADCQVMLATPNAQVAQFPLATRLLHP